MQKITRYFPLITFISFKENSENTMRLSPASLSVFFEPALVEISYLSSYVLLAQLLEPLVQKSQFSWLVAPSSDVGYI